MQPRWSCRPRACVLAAVACVLATIGALYVPNARDGAMLTFVAADATGTPPRSPTPPSPRRPEILPLPALRTPLSRPPTSAGVLGAECAEALARVVAAPAHRAVDVRSLLLAPCARDLAGAVYVYDREFADYTARTGVDLMRPFAGAPCRARMPPPARPPGQVRRSYMDLEIALLEYLLRPEHGLLTRDPGAAKLFFVPQMATSGFRFAWACATANATAGDVERAALFAGLALVSATPAWRRFGGADHVWIFPKDNGIQMFRDFARRLGNRAVLWQYDNARGHGRVAPGAPVTARVLPYDVTVPAMVRALPRLPAVACADGGPWAHHFKWLASFRGDADSRKVVRAQLLALFGSGSAPVLFSSHSTNHAVLRAEAGASAFCLSPLGLGRWAMRTFELIALGCPPVLFEDGLGPTPRPFDALVDWSAFSLEVRAGDVPRTLDVLRAAGGRACEMRRAVAAAADLFAYGPFFVVEGAVPVNVSAAVPAPVALALLDTLAKLARRNVSSVE